MLHVKEIQAKSVLNKSKIFDYCLNPYTGCQINCRYCYARLFMKRYSGHKEAWSDFVDVKINAPEVLQKQLGKAKRGTTDQFFRESKDRLVSELLKRKMKFQALF